MNKVICDVCGTMYPDNAGQCPICGSSSASGAQPIPAEGTQAEAAVGTYGYTKGGHFSKSNVRKRGNASKKASKAVAAKTDDVPEEEESGGSNKGLIIAIILLIIAIVGMLCYIFFTYFSDSLFGSENKPDSTVSTTTQATETNPVEIKCQDMDLQVPNNEITLQKVDHAWLLKVETTPADTTDKITYTTSDPSVAVVSSEGRVTAVGNGTATITVTCGDVVKECKVTCNIETDPTEETVEETTDATEPTEETEATEPTTEPTEPKLDVSKFYLFPRRDGDCTIDVDETFTLQLRDGNGKKVDVEWTATVEGYFSIDGDKITGVSPTPLDADAADKVRAVCVYEGVEFSCIIRVRHPVSTEPILPPETTEYNGPTIDDPGYVISHTDVTIRGGEKFTLTLKDSNGQPVEATWEADMPGFVTIDGNVITGKTKGTTIVSFRVSNWVYECIVRVSSTVTDDSAVG